jgi:hypothetical protein
MAGWSDARLRLREYLRLLRAELSKARDDADDDDLTFDLDGVSLEVDIAYLVGQSEEPEFWVLAPALDVDAKHEPESACDERQRLIVRLMPRAGAEPGGEKTEPPPMPLPRPPIRTPGNSDDDERS